MAIRIKLSILFTIILFSIKLNAQKDTFDIFNMSIEELMSLKVISPTKTSEPIYNSPAVIEVITDLDIKKNDYKSITAALNSVSGLFITSDYVSNNISMRGINSGKKASSRTIKVMINGQPIAFRPTSENFIEFENIPIHLVKRIEILRGPASTLYGSDAFLGIINIITKTGEELSQSSIHVTTNGAQNYGININSGYKIKKLDFIGGFSYSSFDRSGKKIPFSTEILKERLINVFSGVNPFSYATENDISKPASLYLKSNYASRLGEIYASVFGQIINSAAKFYDNNPILNNSKINLYNAYSKLGLKKNYLSNKFNTDFSFTYSNGAYLKNTQFDYSPENTSGTLIKPHVGYNSIDLSGLMVYNYSEKSNLILGLDYKTDNYNLLSYDKIDKSTNEIVSRFTTIGINQFTNLGIYGQIRTTIFDNLNYTLGVRLDNQNIYGNNFNYRTALVYNPQNPFSFKISYGTSFRAPTPVQLFSPEVPYNPFNGVISNPDLNPEYLKTIEIEGNYYTSSGFSFEIVGFYNRASNIIVEKVKASLLSPVNEYNIEGYGIESSVKYTSRKFSMKANYSFQQTWYINKEENYPETNLYPQNMAYIEFNYLANKFLDFYFNIKYTSKYLASSNNIQANLVYGMAENYYINQFYMAELGVNSHNLYLSKNKKNEILIGLKLKNLLNQKQIYAGYNLYDIPGEERSIWLETDFKF
jgi:iron complex outermembrane receptor protein